MFLFGGPYSAVLRVCWLCAQGLLLAPCLGVWQRTVWSARDRSWFNCSTACKASALPTLLSLWLLGQSHMGKTLPTGAFLVRPPVAEKPQRLWPHIISPGRQAGVAVTTNRRLGPQHPRKTFDSHLLTDKGTIKYVCK